MWTTTTGLRGKKLHLAITFTSVVVRQGIPPLDGTSEHVSVLQGAVTACYELGCFFGAIFTLMFGQKTGRTPILVAGGALMILGTVISTASFGPQWGLGQFVIGRVISGLGNGMDTATIPVWQSECSKAHNRGFLVCFEGAIIAVGTFIAYWIDFGLSYVDSSVQWRFPVAFQILFAILVTIGGIMLPESPRWFVMQGHDEQAIEVLAALNDSTVESEDVLADYNMMKADLKSLEGVQASSWKVLFTGGKSQNFQRMMIGCSGQFFQQFTGCNAAIYYSTLLFKNNLHMTGKLPLVLGGVFATVYALATIPSFFMIEKVGRRNLFLIGFLECQGCRRRYLLVHLLLRLYYAPSPLDLPPEINPLRTRTKAASASTCMNWITNFAVVMFTPVFSSQSDWGIYLFFALVNFIAIPFAWFFYAETAGRDLEEVDIIFAKAHIEKKWPYKVAQQLPKLTVEQITQMQAELGLDSTDDLRRASEAEKAETALSSGDSDSNTNNHTKHNE
ncbi:hypothetical protein N7541_002043 [Penicillium brevicompactum]|uniref:Major facilitator superfamily (MFS) profile domain-containing protein n=1 Tax=Penicillium brevicompactum TaxID=5074 RepID=A0A9W9RKZ5_PENBR|nr:hypothetical protein N7452_000217 [Penicillium brevicompactum]KAJ5361199.1 hypothetical protein N7541_002043 [Penicillium brevicompactum]